MPSRSNGVYLGLDTLNHKNGIGTNVEIGSSAKCVVDSKENDGRWLDELSWHGDSHLIYGLYEMKTHAWGDGTILWPTRPINLYGYADYAVFLIYSGLVLASALDRMVQKQLLEFKKPKLIVWGFHDGDLFELGRLDSAGFCRIGKLLEPMI